MVHREHTQKKPPAVHPLHKVKLLVDKQEDCLSDFLWIYCCLRVWLNLRRKDPKTALQCLYCNPWETIIIYKHIAREEQRWMACYERTSKNYQKARDLIHNRPVIGLIINLGWNCVGLIVISHTKWSHCASLLRLARIRVWKPWDEQSQCWSPLHWPTWCQLCFSWWHLLTPIHRVWLVQQLEDLMTINPHRSGS